MERINTPFIAREDITVRKKTDRAGIRKKILIAAGCLFTAAVALCLCLYFFFPIKNIRITGNHYLSEDYLRKLIGISEGDRYFFRLLSAVEDRAEQSELVRKVTVSRREGLSYLIEVEENTIVGYQISGASTDVTSTLILADGQIIPFSAEYMKNIALTPLFINISEDNCRAIAGQLGKLETDILSRISEVSVTSFTYDENMVKLTMEDGYRVYSSINGLGYMKDYFDIVINKSSESGSCILIMEEYASAAVLECSEIEEKYIRPAN